MKEKDNVGILDTAVRSILSCILLALAVEGLYSNTTSLILAALGVVLWISSSTGVCLLYKMLGVDTYHKA
ncbi:YgaP family membrane protein [Bowmanella pacifica]|uniref:Inner membrane protein YgaP-like transmembrane domain-containing protein n=1 Tax=Bowmanella pacifica TaxID=502051 RepID=A0A917Z2C5_9ALTE|nr:DUF2892 domain-containing protein [Bowmanella pacifica]GGO71009.1 hypothetical protein GCM10010982_25790 [Bowmanella pacifica]